MPRTQRNAIPQSPAQRKGRVSLLPQSPALSKKELTVSFKPMPQSPTSGHSCRFQLCPAVRYIVSRPKCLHPAQRLNFPVLCHIGSPRATFRPPWKTRGSVQGGPRLIFLKGLHETLKVSSTSKISLSLRSIIAFFHFCNNWGTFRAHQGQTKGVAWELIQWSMRSCKGF